MYDAWRFCDSSLAYAFFGHGDVKMSRSMVCTTAISVCRIGSTERRGTTCTAYSIETRLGTHDSRAGGSRPGCGAAVTGERPWPNRRPGGAGSFDIGRTQGT